MIFQNLPPEITMRRGFQYLLLIAALALPSAGARAEWQASETVKTYAVSGKSGAELYASIGERGPKVAGGQRTIAHTNFRLTWSRKYEVRENACVLASAQPKLVITYTLPKLRGTLPDTTRRNWETFVAGVEKHERVHGDMIRDLVREIETATVGLTVAEDPQCRKIRIEMTKRLTAISAAHQQRNRDFDRVELSDGGNVHQLILNLVNGG